jgi:putative addiction module killer protein
MELIKIVIYSTKTGKVPYSEWEDGLDKKTNAIVKSRLDRIRLGNFGKVKTIKGSKDIWEIVLDIGPGYRIYYGKKGTTVILLLVGGEKKSQERDIEKAKRYWLDGKELL